VERNCKDNGGQYIMRNIIMYSLHLVSIEQFNEEDGDGHDT
jgi:hypothetical protein